MQFVRRRRCRLGLSLFIHLKTGMVEFIGFWFIASLQNSFAPPNFIFPISAVILRERVDIERVLERFSSSILPFIDYSTNTKGEITTAKMKPPIYIVIGMRPPLPISFMVQSQKL